MLPCSRDLHHAELQRAAPSLVQIGFAEDAAVIGVAVDGSVVRDGSLDAELVHGHHEAEPAARTEHGHDGAHGSVHVAHMLEDGERVGKVEAAGLEVLVHFFRQPLTKRRGARAISRLAIFTLVDDTSTPSTVSSGCRAHRAMATPPSPLPASSTRRGLTAA